MRVILFGATGMVGGGVLRECLQDPEVESVVSVGRSESGVNGGKLREIICGDFFDYSAIESELTGFDACFFCLGISSAGMREREYERVTYGITMAAAEAICRLNPGLTFIYVSGMGTDSSEHGRAMWARVKGKTENALLRMPFRAAYMFRPGLIEATYGVRSRTAWYRVFYAVGKPVLPVLRRMFPHYVLTTEEIGQAMIAVARHGAEKRILETADIRVIVRRRQQGRH